jgi:RNA polymerase sigma-70 factor (sigma-E family)
MGDTGSTFDDRFTDLAAIAYRVAFRLLGSRSEAEEVAQEALARAFVRWGTVAGHDEPWVARVAVNLAIGRWRRRRATVPFEDRYAAPSTDSDAHVLERLGLIDALGRLPRRQREVVTLRYLADLPEREVATAMKTSVGSVKRHTHRAIARLRIELAPLTVLPEVDDA